MKPTSLIFLVLSVILIAAGLITCGIASGMAESDGIELYEQKENDNGDMVYSLDLTDQTVSNFSFHLKNVKVNLYGGSDRARLELVNFNGNGYSRTLDGGQLSITDSFSLTDLIRFSGKESMFHGLRYFLAGFSMRGKEKSINLYLPEGYNISSFDADLTKGEIQIRNMNRDMNYSLSVEDGTIELHSVNSDMQMNVTLGNGTVVYDQSAVKTFEAQIENGSFRNYALSSDSVTYQLATENGSIYYDNVERGKIFNASAMMELSNVKVTVKKGDISIQH